MKTWCTATWQGLGNKPTWGLPSWPFFRSLFAVLARCVKSLVRTSECVILLFSCFLVRKKQILGGRGWKYFGYEIPARRHKRMKANETKVCGPFFLRGPKSPPSTGCLSGLQAQCSIHTIFTGSHPALAPTMANNATHKKGLCVSERQQQ